MSRDGWAMLERAIALKEAWGEPGDPKWEQMRAAVGLFRSAGMAAPDAEIAEVLLAELELRDEKLHEAFELLGGVVDSTRARTARATRGKRAKAAAVERTVLDMRARGERAPVIATAVDRTEDRIWQILRAAKRRRPENT